MEESGAALLQGGVPLLQKHLKTLDEGGVLFLDEAYQLNPKTNPGGAQASGLSGCEDHFHSQKTNKPDIE